MISNVVSDRVKFKLMKFAIKPIRTRARKLNGSIQFELFDYQNITIKVVRASPMISLAQEGLIAIERTQVNVVM